MFVATTSASVLFNEKVPAAAGYINEVLTKKNLRGIIDGILKATDIPTTGEFLDQIKTLGYKFDSCAFPSFKMSFPLVFEFKPNTLLNIAFCKCDVF